MTVVVVAEKPSVARDIAQVVGAQTRASGWLHGNGYVVTWAIGHLVGLTTVITAVAAPVAASPAASVTVAASTPIIDRFHTVGTAVIQPGWKVLDIPARMKGNDAEEQSLPADLGKTACEIQIAAACQEERAADLAANRED